MAAVSREWLEPVWAAGAAGELPSWTDVEWYALDESNSVGMFCSGGPGPIPRAVFRDLDTHLALVDYLNWLPVRGKHELLVHYPRVTDFTQAADRGLFAFNYEYSYGGAVVHGYRLVASPVDLLPLDALPGWAQDWLDAIRIAGTVFADTTGVIVDLSGVQSGLVG